jgi:hypothetical protein
MSVALLVSTFTEIGEGVDPVMLYKFYELSDATRPFEKIALLHLKIETWESVVTLRQSCAMVLVL